MWDAGYPEGGNHWGTKYNLEDHLQGPLQDQPGSDGIGDTPVHLVIGQILDNYPRIEPCSNIAIDYPDTPEISNIPTTITCTVNTPEFKKDSTIKIEIEGKINPSISDVTVNITMSNKDQNLGLIRLSVQTDSEGRYHYEELPNREAGTYEVRAFWKGNSMYLGAESDETSFKIVEEVIPGSPWESILLGGILGFGAIYLLRKRKISI